MVKYQRMLCDNPHIWLEVVNTLNLAALLPVGLGCPEYDCSEVMDEIFSSWPDLTSLLATQTLHISQMAAACRVCDGNAGLNH
jgi:hypothetical protein